MNADLSRLSSDDELSLSEGEVTSDEEDPSENELTELRLLETLKAVAELQSTIQRWDPSMSRALRFCNTLQDAVQPYVSLLRQMRNQAARVEASLEER